MNIKNFMSRTFGSLFGRPQVDTRQRHTTVQEIAAYEYTKAPLDIPPDYSKPARQDGIRTTLGFRSRFDMWLLAHVQGMSPTKLSAVYGRRGYDMAMK